MHLILVCLPGYKVIISFLTSVFPYSPHNAQRCASFSSEVYKHTKTYMLWIPAHHDLSHSTKICLISLYLIPSIASQRYDTIDTIDTTQPDNQHDPQIFTIKRNPAWSTSLHLNLSAAYHIYQYPSKSRIQAQIKSLFCLCSSAPMSVLSYPSISSDCHPPSRSLLLSLISSSPPLSWY